MNKATFLPVFIIVYLLSAINPVYSQDNKQIKNYGVSFGTSFGVLYGQVFEYVYPIPGDTKGEFLSELTWDMKPVCYLGLNVDFGLIDPLSKPGFFSSLSFKAGFPGDSGKMEDRDWMSIENANLTNFSSHTNLTQELIFLDLLVGASIPIKYLYIKPFLSGSWMRFSFTARDGEGQYARKKGNNTYYPIDDAPQNISFEGMTVINYQQDWFILATGAVIGTNILAPFSFDLSFKISPLTYCAATDNHLLTSTIFKDFTSFGLFIEPSLSASLTVKNIIFSLGASYRYISPTKGESFMNNNRGFELSSNEAGAGLSLWDFQFLINIKF